VCEENGLKYFLVGGTALGAVRHQGFIPWDDDVDVAMPREDFEKLKQLYRSRYIQHSFYRLRGVDEKKYRYNYLKYDDSRTTYLENKFNNKYKSGVFIDIFPLDGICDKKEAIIRRSYLIYLLRSVRYANDFRLTYMNFFYVLPIKALIFIIGGNKITKLINRIIFQYPYNKSEMVGNYLGAYREREFVNKHIFGKGKRIKFERSLFWVPEKCEEYLENIYGDYMKLPPEKSRIPHHIKDVNIFKGYEDDKQ